MEAKTKIRDTAEKLVVKTGSQLTCKISRSCLSNRFP